ncbi:MAG: hypothetical protein JWM64_1059 [Frankiales bacterium]|nr:hypothetical protein [Frankiales bacterium]
MTDEVESGGTAADPVVERLHRVWAASPPVGEQDVETVLARLSVAAARRRRRRQAVMTAAAAAVVLVAAVTVAGTATHDEGVLRQTVADPPASAPAAPSPATTPAPVQSATPSTPPVAGSGFRGRDLSWVSTRDGVALGDLPCGSGRRCVQLRVTDDGGRTWSTRTAPGPGSFAVSTDDRCGACVRAVRFADVRSGYAYGPQGLWTTADGGSTWQQQTSKDVEGLEVAGGTAVRVVADCLPDCAGRVERAAVGSDDWQPLPTGEVDLRGGAVLARSGRRLLLGLTGRTAHGVGDLTTHLLLSDNSGDSWTRRDDPCARSGQDPVWTTSALSVSGSDAVLLCQPTRYRDRSTRPRLLTSRDGGASFTGSEPPLPAGTEADQAFGVAVAAGGRHGPVADVAVDRSQTLSQLTSGGWTGRASEPQPDGTLSSWLGFTTPDVGHWLGSSGDALWTTSDGGRHWSARAWDPPPAPSRTADAARPRGVGSATDVPCQGTRLRLTVPDDFHAGYTGDASFGVVVTNVGHSTCRLDGSPTLRLSRGRAALPFDLRRGSGMGYADPGPHPVVLPPHGPRCSPSTSTAATPHRRQRPTPSPCACLGSPQPTCRSRSTFAGTAPRATA